MSNIDDIFERLKGQKPVISEPDELTDIIMDSLTDISEITEHKRARVVKLRWWMAMAASLIIVIGIGVPWIFNGEQTGTTHIVAKVEHDNTYDKSVMKVSSIDTSSHVAASRTIVAPNLKSLSKDAPKTEKTPQIAVSDPNLHYTTYEQAKDTLPYQDPARVDDFIAKLAAFHNAKQVELTCSVPLDSNMVSVVYVFPDMTTVSSSSQEIDIFARLLQVACWYHCETPGYFLNFSQQQFFFQLKDLRKQLRYCWIAERINGKILLYGTNAPIGVETSSVCYQEYRNKFMNEKSINTKTTDI